MPTRPPQVRLPTSGPEVELAEHPGQEVAARAGRLVDDHDLGAEDRGAGRADRLAVAGGPVADQRPAQEVDVVVGHLAAAVEPLVDDDGLLVGLREEVALEVGVARARRCWARRRRRRGPSVRSWTLRRLPSTQSRLRSGPSSAIGSTTTVRGAGAVGPGADLELDALADRVLEVAVDLAVGLDLLAVDGQQELARLDVHARRASAARGGSGSQFRPRRRPS